MKKVSRRALLALILAFVLLAGTGWFTVNWAVQSRNWIFFPGSPHMYENGRLARCSLTDRHGTVLLQRDGAATYAADGALRAAAMHLVGDPTGNIPEVFTRTFLRDLVDFETAEGLHGKPMPQLRLTVSGPVQTAALEALEGRKGTVGVYNYKTGEILCAVTSPTYDPLDAPDIAGDTTGMWDGVYVNRFINAAYVPGSVFKLVTAAAALETLPDAADRRFDCTGEMAFGVDKVICAGEHGQPDLQEALARSCNCAFAQLALELGPETLTAYAEKLGVAASFSFDGIVTKAGQFDLSVPVDVNVAWAGIGQYTDLVSPLGFLRYMGVIAGGGAAAEPYLVSSAGSYRAEPRRTEQLLSPETAATLQAYMEQNVQTVYGAGHFPDLTVCAKSGTAETGEGMTPHATFAGFCADPEYPLAFFAVVEHGGAGSAVCAPIIGRVLEACTRMPQ